MEFVEEPELAIEVFFNEAKYEKVFLTINSFRGKEYFHIRKYYLDFEGEYLPTNQGVSFPASLETTVALFDSLCQILDESEVLQTVIDNSTSLNKE